MPAGACSLWPDTDSRSTGICCRSTGTLPTACTASVWNRMFRSARDFRDLRDRKQHAGFIVRPHQRDECGACSQCLPERIEVQPPLGVDRQVGDVHALRLQVTQQHQRRGMFDLAGDDVAPVRARGERSEDGQMIRFGAAAGEYDFRSRCAEAFGHRQARIGQHPFGALAQAVLARCVERSGTQAGVDGVQTLRRERGRCIVIEVDAPGDHCQNCRSGSALRSASSSASWLYAAYRSHCCVL